MKRNNHYQFFSAKILLLILLLALAIRLLFFLSLKPWDNEVAAKITIDGDAKEYNKLALSLISERSFKDFNGYRTPGYPVFIAFLYSAFSSSVWFVLFVQLILSVISVLLVYKIALTFFSRATALISALFFSIDINQVENVLMMYTDILFAFLFLASIYFLCKGLKENNFYIISFSAFILGIATFVRPISFLLPFVVILFILIFLNFKLRLRMAYSLIFGVIFTATISPWSLRNYMKFGEAKLTTQSGTNLLFCNVAETEAFKSGKSMEQVKMEFQKLASMQGANTTERNPFKVSQIYTDIAQRYIRNNFILYSKRHLMGCVNLFTNLSTRHLASILHIESTRLSYDYFAGPGLSSQIVKFYHSKTSGEISIAIGLVIYLLVNYLFAIYAMFLLIRGNKKFVFLFILIILYFTVITGVIGLARLRIPFMPIINILAAAGIFYTCLKKVDKFNYLSLYTRDFSSF